MTLIQDIQTLIIYTVTDFRIFSKLLGQNSNEKNHHEHSLSPNLMLSSLHLEIGRN